MHVAVIGHSIVHTITSYTKQSAVKTIWFNERFNSCIILFYNLCPSLMHHCDAKKAKEAFNFENVLKKQTSLNF